MAYIIAECGVNHNGDLEMASRMISAAHESGADCVKFQLFDAEKLEPPGPRREMLKPLQLSHWQIARLKTEAEEVGIDFLCTPFDVESLEFLIDIGCRKIKIGSADAGNRSLFDVALKHPITIIASTGMLGEFSPFPPAHVLLHCTSSYPCPLGDVNLMAMTRLPKPYGLSDHTLSTVIPAAAVALGAEYVEKHFTLDRNMDGPDHKASLEPKEFAEMVKNIREVELALGDGVKRVMPSEKEVMKVRDEREKWRQGGA